MEWISVKDSLPEMDFGTSEEVLCMGRKGTHRHEPNCYVKYEIMRFEKLARPELKNSSGEWILYGWSNRWWDTNPDLFQVEYWMPLPEPPKP